MLIQLDAPDEPTINGDLIATIAAKAFDNYIVRSAGNIVASSVNIGRNNAAKQFDAKGAAYSAILDGAECDFCASLDGLETEIDSADYAQFSPPQHGNCRCQWVFIGSDEEGSIGDDDFHQAAFGDKDETAIGKIVRRFAHANEQLQTKFAKGVAEETAAVSKRRTERIAKKAEKLKKQAERAEKQKATPVEGKQKKADSSGAGKEPPSGHGSARPSSDDGREAFKKKAEERIRSDRFVQDHSEAIRFAGASDVQTLGEDAILGREGAFNVALDQQYSKWQLSDEKSVIYHQYVGWEEHGAELAASFRDNGLPHDFKVGHQASTVYWDPDDKDWAAPKGLQFGKVNGADVARSVQYAMRFPVETEEQAQRMLQVIDDRFTKHKNDAYEHSWETPDVRITGFNDLPGTGAVAVNVMDGKTKAVLTLSREQEFVVDSKGRVLVNEALWRFIE